MVSTWIRRKGGKREEGRKEGGREGRGKKGCVKGWGTERNRGKGERKGGEVKRGRGKGREGREEGRGQRCHQFPFLMNRTVHYNFIFCKYNEGWIGRPTTP